MGRVTGIEWCDHKKGGDPDEWPEGLRVREFPAATAGATS